MREWLCGWLNCDDFCDTCIDDSDVPPPDIVDTLTANQLKQIAKAEFGEDIPILIPDNNYELATMSSFLTFLADDNTDKYKYTGDPGLDCDDFASILQGRASIPGWSTVPIGTIWCTTPNHALNWFVDENKKLFLVEPQDDRVFLDDGTYIPYVLWL